MKNIIELSGIILPALIIILGIIRVFAKKTQGINGLTMLFAILLLIIGFTQYFIFKDNSSGNNEPKPQPLAVSKHSAVFNQSIEKVLNAYFRMTDAFVNNDISAINQFGNELKTDLDSLKLEELKADTLIYETALQPFDNAKAEIASIVADPSVDEKRGSLNIFSNELYTLLRTLRYDLAKVYWKECPFAFGDSKPGYWLSKTEETLNPYGKEDCAIVRSMINFVPADSSKNEESTKE
ncbi:MAG TPA: DUF3347 domain-containing protein [Chitinophagaceae bacterium]|nr:DUF3347 domain-containing protein [Chitinophagaceae bacterium]